MAGEHVIRHVYVPLYVTVCLPAGSEPPPVLPLNVIYILTYLLPLSSVNLPCTCFSHSMSQISCPFSSALVTYPKTQSRSEALCDTWEEAYFLWWGLVSSMTNPESGGTPLVDCYITLHIHKLRPPSATWGTWNAMMTRTHLTCWCSLIAIVCV
jgi:hypothetical protein